MKEGMLPAVLGWRAGWGAGSLAGEGGVKRIPPPATRVGLAEGCEVGCAIESMPASGDSAAGAVVGCLGAGAGGDRGGGGLN